MGCESATFVSTLCTRSPPPDAPGPLPSARAVYVGLWFPPFPDFPLFSNEFALCFFFAPQIRQFIELVCISREVKTVSTPVVMPLSPFTVCFLLMGLSPAPHPEVFSPRATCTPPHQLAGFFFLFFAAPYRPSRVPNKSLWRPPL